MINYDRALELLNEVISEEPEGAEFVYQTQTDLGRHAYGRPNCLYAVEDENGNAKGDCIVGRVLVKLGVDPALMIYRDGMSLYDDRPEDRNRYSKGGALSMIPRLMADGLVEEFSEEAAFFLGEVQALQDNGHSWGEAVRLNRK